MALTGIVNLDDLRQRALALLPRNARDYYEGGARDEQTLRENQRAWSDWRVRYRVLTGNAAPDLGTTILDTPVDQPVLVAPTAFHRLAWPEGEVATARAAASRNTLMCLSTLSTCGMEEVVQAAPGRTWFQLYVYRDRDATLALVERAVSVGCTALVLTVDAPILGTREQDVRNGFHLPEGMCLHNLIAQGYQALPVAAGTSGLASYVAQLLDPAISWDTVRWLRDVQPLPLLVKGIVRADDARRAVDAGVDGVVVSNHGGRQLDGAVPTAHALPEVAEAIAGRATVLVDGGIRRGVDVLRALALGANGVMVGRPVLWGLAAGGEAGVTCALDLLRDELTEAMALAGCGSVAEIAPDLLSRA